jgi:ankyrin repeat protein
MASANGHLEIVKLLLENKADPNLQNSAKNTPLRMSNSFIIYEQFLDWAALNGRRDITELLLLNKADPNIKNEFDRIPLEEAL